MKKLILYLPLYAFLAVALLSCKKEVVEDPQIDGTPIFKVAGTLGGEELLIQAGIDNNYMHTFGQQMNGVDQYCGKLGNSDQYLEIGIFNGNLDMELAPDPSILQSEVSFAGLPQEPLAFLSKSLFPNAYMIEEVKWFLNGTLSGINDVEIMLPGKYFVCAQVKFNDGSTQELCNTMILGYQKNATAKIRHFLTQGGDLTVWIDQASVPVERIEWYVDGEFVTESDKLELEIDSYSHEVKTEIKFENGAHRTKAILVDGSLSGRFIEDFSVFEANQVGSAFWDYKMAISVKNNGKLYSSIVAPNESSVIEIQEINYYGKNAAGKSVFLVKAHVEVLLKEMQTSEVLPLNCDVVFGVEIE